MISVSKTHRVKGRKVVYRLVADTLAELHDMATQLGIGPASFNVDEGYYLIGGSAKRRALELGVKEGIHK